MTGAGAKHVTQLQTHYLQSQELNEKRKRKRRRGLFRRLAVFLVVFTLACTFMISSLSAQFRQLDKAAKEKTAMQKQLSQSKSEAGKLKERINLLHNKDYVGEIARRDYLLSKGSKGEIIFSAPGHNQN